MNISHVTQLSSGLTTDSTPIIGTLPDRDCWELVLSSVVKGLRLMSDNNLWAY